MKKRFENATPEQKAKLKERLKDVTPEQREKFLSEHPEAKELLTK
jgi:hypothetical protein